jgi:hypothetical protein
MRLFKTKDFARSARKNAISDRELGEAVRRAEAGLIDADLGAHLIKQRVGQRGAYRTIIFHQEGNRAVFLYIFGKSGKSNLTSMEAQAYRDFAKQLAGLGRAVFDDLVAERKWEEIAYEPRQKDLPERPAAVASPRGQRSRGGRSHR